MLSISKEKLVEKICEKAGVDAKLVNEKIKAKVKELNGLVSEEGAAYIVASELSVNLLEGIGQKKLKIKDIEVGMRGVNISGRVSRVFEVREFKTKDKQGKVGSFIIGDDTGTIRVVIWNEQTSALEKLKQGLAIRVSGGYCRSSTYSGKELHLGLRSNIEKLSDEDAKELPSADELGSAKAIGDASPSDSIVAMGTIVQAYRPAFYNVCSECNSSLKEGKCKDHPDAAPKAQMVLSFMLDDGKTCTRCVSFREVAEKLAGMTPDEAKGVIVDKNEAALQDATEARLLGKIIEVKGRMKYNQSFNRSEVLVNSSRVVDDPKELIPALTGDK